MLGIASISAVVAAMSVAVGVVIAVMQIRDVVRTRHIKLIQLNPNLNVGQSEIQEAWSKMWNVEHKDCDDFVKKRGLSSQVPVISAIGTVSSYFEGIGFFLHKQPIDIDIVDYVACGTVKMAREKLKLMFEGYRKQCDLPRPMQRFEFLHSEIPKKKRAKTLTLSTA